MNFEEKLIELVRENRCLYMKSEANYKNNLKKEKIWKKISEELNIPLEKLKTRWKTLRNGYRLELKKVREAPSGSAATTESQWKFFNHLSFLENSIGTSQTTTSNYSTPSVTELRQETAAMSFGDNIETTDSTCLDAALSSTMLLPEIVNNSSQSASGDIPAALTGGGSSRTPKKASTLSTLEENYSKFLESANEVIKVQDMTQTRAFMHSMTLKIEKANLSDEQMDDLQESLHYFINKKLKVYREANNKK